MKQQNAPRPRTLIRFSAASVLALPAFALAALAPYTPDASTLHLWHLNEATPGALPAFAASDSVDGAGAVTLDIKGGAKFTVPSLSAGLGGALDTRGIPGSGQAPGAFGPEDLPLNQFTGTDGAFTIEAILNLGFDPTQPGVATRTDPLQIVSLDNEGADSVRPFQWRILPANHAENTSGLWAIEFLNIAPVAGIERFQFPLPATGPEMLAAGAWYHVAITFNGEAATEGNLTTYWTRLGQGTQSAQLLASATMTNPLGDGVATTPGDFTVGNLGRGTASNNFVGLIDEVRISGIARGPNQFNLNGAPYSVDADTLHLHHFDEPNPANFPSSLQTFATDSVTSSSSANSTPSSPRSAPALTSPSATSAATRPPAISSASSTKSASVP